MTTMTTLTSARLLANSQQALRQLVCTTLCVFALGSVASAVASSSAELKLLDDRAAWALAPTSAGPVWEADSLLVPALVDGNSHLQQALRPIALGAAASWRARLSLAAVKPAAADAALGLVLVNAQGGVLAVMLRPVERDLIVIRASKDKWRNALTGYVAAPMLASPVTAANILEVQSQGSRLRISVNGQDLLTTPLLDFSPVKIGLRASNTQARVDQFIAQQTGLDTRLARLAGLTKAPGAQVNFEDLLADTPVATKAAQSLLSGVGKLFGNKPEATKSLTPIDASQAWPSNDTEGDAIFTRDIARKRIVMQTKTADEAYQIVPNSLDPMGYAAVAVQATVVFPLLSNDGNGGLVLLQSSESKSSSPALLYVQIGPTELRLSERSIEAGKNKWQLIDKVAHGIVTTRPFTLRLVHQGTSAWVFIDGWMVMAVDNVNALRINNAGIRSEGVTTIELSQFLFTDI
jgi:hypothetical protein